MATGMLQRRSCVFTHRITRPLGATMLMVYHVPSALSAMSTFTKSCAGLGVSVTPKGWYSGAAMPRLAGVAPPRSCRRLSRPLSLSDCWLREKRRISGTAARKHSFSQAPLGKATLCSGREFCRRWRGRESCGTRA